MLLNKLKTKALSLGRPYKVLLVVFGDYSLFLLSYLLIFSLNSESSLLLEPILLLKNLATPILWIFILYSTGTYRSLVRFINFSNIIGLIRILILISLLDILASVFLFNYSFLGTSTFALKDSILYWLLCILLILSIRLMASSFLSEQISSSRVIIYGAGSAGVQLASALRYSSEMTPIAFVDDNKALQGTFLGGVKVVEPKKIGSLIRNESVDEVLIAMPSQSKASLRNILKEVQEYSIKVRILPGVAELAQGKVSVAELKEVDIEDLLGRIEVKANQDLINKNIKGKVVMVTGAGGSIGSEISRQVLVNNPRLLIIFDLNEFSLYSIKQELIELKSEVRIESILGNVRNKTRVEQVCETFRVQTIYHAAAYKHVPLVEENPFEAVSNNIFGTLNCVQVAIESKVETFVLISTDKAVRPTNIMGATKRFAELILQSLAEKYQSKLTTISMVRFGNVLGSSGSAIPLFQKQLKEGGPLTVTDPEVIRYFMSLSEAAELVIQAGAMGKGGDVFVLDMGEPVRILELAERLIKLSGMEVKSQDNPEGDIEIIFTGLRPGEKLYEELLIGDDVKPTKHKHIYRANEDFILWQDLKEYLSKLKTSESSLNHEELRRVFKQTVSGFMPKDEIRDVIYLEDKKSSL